MDASVQDKPLEPRKASVLRAIVGGYVRTGEPVGSRTIATRHRLNVSPATIRSDMSVLEADGYITQPHTSAGRIPTDRGYRWYVDSWLVEHPEALLRRDERRQIMDFFQRVPTGVEQTLGQTSQFLSQLCNAAAVVLAPLLDQSRFRRLEAVGRSHQRMLLVLIHDTGRVQQRSVELKVPSDVHFVDEALQVANEALSGVFLNLAPSRMKEVVRTSKPEIRPCIRLMADALNFLINEQLSNTVYLGGTSNIVSSTKFSDMDVAHEVVGALEQHGALVRFFADALRVERFSVFIGSEVPLAGMATCSVVSAPYGSVERRLGTVGIVGPTRMDYPRTIGLVEEVARALGEALTPLSA